MALSVYDVVDDDVEGSEPAAQSSNDNVVSDCLRAIPDAVDGILRSKDLYRALDRLHIDMVREEKEVLALWAMERLLDTEKRQCLESNDCAMLDDLVFILGRTKG